MQPIRDRIKTVGAAFFAIGIGKGHANKLLKKIASRDKNFNGTYIDTTKGETIKEVLGAIYTKATAIFKNLKLSFPQLKTKWAVEGENISGNSHPLGDLSKKGEIIKRVKILSENLESPLDLSKVSPQLSFEDPNGKKGTLSLPWGPNTVMDPAILY